MGDNLLYVTIPPTSEPQSRRGKDLEGEGNCIGSAPQRQDTTRRRWCRRLPGQLSLYTALGVTVGQAGARSGEGCSHDPYIDIIMAPCSQTLTRGRNILEALMLLGAMVDCLLVIQTVE